MANFYINVFIIAHANLCKIGRAPYGVRLISYNGTVRHCTVPVWAPADVFIYRRRTAPVRYVTMQEKILKNRLVPGRLSNSPVMCTSLKSYDVSFICNHSIIRLQFFCFMRKNGIKIFIKIGLMLYSFVKNYKFSYFDNDFKIFHPITMLLTLNL